MLLPRPRRAQFPEGALLHRRGRGADGVAASVVHPGSHDAFTITLFFSCSSLGVLRKVCARLWMLKVVCVNVCVFSYVLSFLCFFRLFWFVFWVLTWFSCYFFIYFVFLKFLVYFNRMFCFIFCVFCVFLAYFRFSFDYFVFFAFLKFFFWFFSRIFLFDFERFVSRSLLMLFSLSRWASAVCFKGQQKAPISAMVFHFVCQSASLHCWSEYFVSLSPFFLCSALVGSFLSVLLTLWKVKVHVHHFRLVMFSSWVHVLRSPFLFHESLLKFSSCSLMIP